MNSLSAQPEERPLAVELEDVRRALRAQRQVIALRLGPEPSTTTSTFPRSKTMRFLIQRPAAAVQLLAGAATFLVGARAVKVVSSAVVVAGLVRSVTRR